MQRAIVGKADTGDASPAALRAYPYPRHKGGDTIAIYHCSIKIISRGKGRSAVAAAAYRSGQMLTNDYDGITHDYTRKRGIVHSEILLPEHAPAAYADRATLWNAVEEIEKNSNAQLAREIEIALPAEFDRQAQLVLVRAYVNDHFVSAGMCADVAIHDKNDGNPHAHIMLTMRPFKPGGEWGAKSRKEYITGKEGQRVKLKNGRYKTRKVNTVDWNDQGKAEQWRAAWAEAVNRALFEQGITERVDHRSYQRQGVDRIPSVHLGVSATQMERRGISTDRGDLNRQIAADNKLLYEIRRRLSRLREWLNSAVSAAIDGQNNRLDKEAASVPPINLIEALTAITSGQEQRTKWQKVKDLKALAKAVAYLQAEHITTMPQLQEKVSALWDDFEAAMKKIKTAEKRLKLLNEHITQAEAYRQYQPIYRQYQREKPRKQAAFWERHSAELSSYQAAEKYLTEQKAAGVPLSVKAWKAEAAQLTHEKDRLYADMRQLRAEAVQVDMLRRSIERALSEQSDKTRSQEIEH